MATRTNVWLATGLSGMILAGALAVYAQGQNDSKSGDVAADPKKVTAPGGNTQGYGNHPRGTNDPMFSAQELLGRPTADSITVNAAAVKDLDVYYEYGTKPGTYTGKTAVTKFHAGEPTNVVIDKLKGDTQYYYRMNYKEAGAAKFTPRAEHSFHTQRAPGSAFTFVAEFDPHMLETNSNEAFSLTLKKMAADKPDFMLDLGDNFFSDREKPTTKSHVTERVQLLRSYWDILNHSSALFLALGNHEGEWGSNLNGTDDNVAIYDTLARKRYFPNPEPDKFYTGGGKAEPIVGTREAYYAFTWGDATFIVLDPYWYKPQPPEQAGDWWTTLGKEQYEWLRTTLANIKSKYKFIFSHNLIGGLDMMGKMRGGIETVKFLEMGGYNLDGTWGWDKARPGWEMPIHQLLVKYNASIYFHGHDHLYVKQDLDGIVYQEGPVPASANGKSDATKAAKQYSYTHGTVEGGGGYLRVRVSPQETKVEFVHTYRPSEEDATHKDGMVGNTYTVKPHTN